MLPKQQQQRQHTRTHAPTEIVSLEVDPARERLHAGGSRRGRATLPAGRRAGPTGRGHSNGAPRLWLRGGGGAQRVRRRRSKPRSRPKKGGRRRPCFNYPFFFLLYCGLVSLSLLYLCFFQQFCQYTALPLARSACLNPPCLPMPAQFRFLPTPNTPSAIHLTSFP